ncbi:hypothetical protein A3E49_01535 [Candidatus Saccharibacteria bacterium RIFCSPHIGHO2_12_FULL_49_19]|nr:MAG: hypothetical protein A2708_02900 [Candidatus Saccharibacteria bacterium RIFCSPHIGHO2_01_FULL_49_21]OGL37109.1 MAG: hypothetical protein A3E49_01535 [Candidatus Saccharibacteria bacterium RIFCSPHIGHO2_12_FULL_49_19]
MKLLLTSGGVSNSSIADELAKLVGKSPANVKVAYIPVAAGAEPGNKDWVIKDFINYWRYGYNYIDIVDPSADGVDWRPRLIEADIIALSGGNTFHLLDQVRKTGLDNWFNKNLKGKVYVGGSASSLLATPNIEVAGIGTFGDKNLPGLTDLTGMDWVDFEIIPHVPGWASYKDCEHYAKTTKNKVYALDDSSAISVTGGKRKVISEGAWKLYNG